jgi:hypothetical protein
MSGFTLVRGSHGPVVRVKSGFSMYWTNVIGLDGIYLYAYSTATLYYPYLDAGAIRIISCSLSTETQYKILTIRLAGFML